VYAHLDDDLARPAQPPEGRHPLPDAESFAHTLGRLGVTSDSAVVAYDDQGGAIAARLWWMLGWIGHRHRFLLNGGLKAWQAAEFPLESGETIRASVDYGPVSANDALRVSTADILRWQDSAPTHTQVLLDARAATRYRGESEPIDPVAGHVPGARNLPFTELLDADGRFLSPDALTALFSNTLGADPSSASVIAMCGSGVTACHLLAGLAVAGYAGRLYVGSWSEWIRDSSRAVAADSA
jgi:thiosulfate/3-mercaptopyruvate sulfurtransferase